MKFVKASNKWIGAKNSRQICKKQNNRTVKTNEENHLGNMFCFVSICVRFYGETGFRETISLQFTTTDDDDDTLTSLKFQVLH